MQGQIDSTYFLILGFASILAFYSLKYFIIFSKHLKLMAIPNERSSHKKPIPSGAGIFIALSFFVSLGLFYFTEKISLQWFLPLLVSVPLVTIVGFIDDIKPLSAKIRLSVHLLAAFLAILVLTKFYQVPLVTEFLPINSQILLSILTLLFVGWMINLYNFMDGIDGLAGIGAFTVSLWCTIIVYLQGFSELFYIYSLLLFLVAIFLWFNWYPAKMFLGDSGSYFLGCFFAVAALMGDQYNNGMSVGTNIILLAGFIVDPSYTLITRFKYGKSITKPHQTFGFHKAKIRGFRTSFVAFSYGMYNLFYLGPIALMSVKFPAYTWAFVIVAFLPMIVFNYKIDAGRDADSPNKKL